MGNGERPSSISRYREFAPDLSRLSFSLANPIVGRQNMALVQLEIQIFNTTLVNYFTRVSDLLISKSLHG